MNICGIEFEEIGSINEKEPIVSVWCLTYNHKSYIRECFDNILAQKVDFEYEVVVLDDASTDGTTEIVREYCKRYPGIFRCLLPCKNIFKDSRRWKIIKNIKSKIMKGKYIAYCECDDYWCDDNKLKMQVDFLEKNKDYSLVMHNAKKLNFVTNQKTIMMKNEESGTVYPEDVIRQNNGMWPTASMMGRKEIWTEMPDFLNCGIGDWPSQLFACTMGKVYYMSEAMSVYRYMLPGSWSVDTYTNWKKMFMHTVRMVDMLKAFNRYTKGIYEEEIKTRMGFFLLPICDFCSAKDEEIDEIIVEMNKTYDNRYQVLLSEIKSLILKIREKRFFTYINKEIIENMYANKKVVIFSASTAGKRVLTLFKSLDLKAEKFADNDDKKNGQYIEDIQIIHVSELEKYDKNNIVIQVASPEYNGEICRQLKELGWNYFSIIDFVKVVFEGWISALK